MKKIKYFIAAMTMAAMIVTGCSSKGGSQLNQNNSVNQSGEEQSETNVSNGSQTNVSYGEISELLTSLGTTSEVVVDTEFTARDLEVGYEESLAVFITLNDNTTQLNGNGVKSDGNTITINKEGTYVLQGNLSDGQIVIDVSDTEKVQLVLDGATIHSSTSAPIYIKNGDKVFITLKEGSVNTLSDGTEYVQTDDNTVDGVIFSKADLTLNGSGTLNITGNYKHGIVSKDDIIITGGTYNITVVKDAINGKDAVKIKDGTFNLSSDTGNGIQSKHDSNSQKGYVYIAGGTITVVKSQEGIEGTVVIIDDGIITINAEDDGLNAASGSSDSTQTELTPDNMQGMPRGNGQPSQWGSTTEGQGTPPEGMENDNGQLPQWGSTTEGQEAPSQGMASGNGQLPQGEGTNDEQGNTMGERPEGGQRMNPGNFGGGFGQGDANCYILINGGTIQVNAKGDGIDSNGDLYITGGTLYVNGPTDRGNGAIDYDGKAEISGGTVVATGSAGMAYSFSDTSTQYSILYNFSNVSPAGTEVKLTDSNQNVLASFTPDKEYQSVVISTKDMKKDVTYTISSGEQSEEITLTSMVTTNGQQGMGGFGTGRPTR